MRENIVEGRYEVAVTISLHQLYPLQFVTQATRPKKTSRNSGVIKQKLRFVKLQINLRDSDYYYVVQSFMSCDTIEAILPNLFMSCDIL